MQMAASGSNNAFPRPTTLSQEWLDAASLQHNRCVDVYQKCVHGFSVDGSASEDVMNQEDGGWMSGLEITEAVSESQAFLLAETEPNRCHRPP